MNREEGIQEKTVEWKEYGKEETERKRVGIRENKLRRGDVKGGK